jgi:glycosyltransferase involved in cell wall biosynthesis
MSTGTPVIASETSSLAENLQGAVEFVPVGQVGELTRVLRRLLGDEVARDRLRTAGLRRAADFRWERTARATLDCYEELAANPPTTPGRS